MDPDVWEGQLLVGSIPGIRGSHYYRVTHFRSKDNSVFIRQVWRECPETTSTSKRYELAAVQSWMAAGRLIEIEESIRPKEMGEQKKDPAEELKARQVAEYRIRLLGKLIEPKGRMEFYASRSRRGTIVREQAKKSKVSVARLYMLITIYENFGCNTLALRPYPSAKTRSRGPITKKRGMPNVFEKRGESTEEVGHAVTRWALRHIQWAIWHLVIRMGLTYETARIVMHRLFWHQDNGSAELGTRVRYPVRESRAVSSGEFGYYARVYKRRVKVLKRLVGYREWRDHYAAGRGTAADLVLGPGDMIVMDCTTAKFEIVDAVFGIPIGRPTIAIVVDQATGTVLGIALSLLGESASLYRKVLFRACTSQSKLMQRLGLPPDYFEYRALANDVFVDRGKGNSAAIREPLTVEDGPEMGILIAPIACGRAKGVGEGLFNIVARRISKLAGGFTRERSERARDERRGARKVAKVTRIQLLKYLYEAAKAHNEGLDFRDLSIQMRKEGVTPTRGEIYNNAIKGRHGGERTYYGEVDFYTGLLPRNPPKPMQKAGVKYMGAVFTSSEYQRTYENEIAKALGRRRSLPKIVTMPDPDDPTILFWKRGPGDIITLRCSEKDCERWNGLHVEDVNVDLKEADIKARIRYEKKRTFVGVLPDYIVDSLVRARTTLHAGASEVNAVARDDEIDRERADSLAESRTYQDLVGASSDDKAPPRDRSVSSPTLEPTEEDAVDASVRSVREARMEALKEGLKKILKREQ
ncbi:hypothetical protein BN2476_1250020 [Paraburkholderia piptadeniae]|uniref:Integrase catalytic domain-containing protein n=1 Tax=Paraburkholderia piptadeniae TaxID=1701573 RepID=A0A1N7SW00_9BURK|nr:hypothetical protein [Paraburkholderia piptadeniae]SIT51621.1 hypothetical protein BN2476_1250020 [Paraburkholderia piptadeniae]